MGEIAHIRKVQFRQRHFHKARLLLNGFRQREPDVRQHQSERNAGETGAGSGIEHLPGAGEQPPGKHGIEHMFDGSFTGRNDSGQIEVLIRFHNQFEMLAHFS